MDKFEDAFKKISKVNLATHIELWGEPKTENLYFEAGQQSRQAEVDQLQSQINEMAEVGLSQESAIREKDKRIERATAKWISIVTILTTTDTGVPDAIFKQLDQLHDALCGMNEIGDNNANY